MPRPNPHRLTREQMHQAIDDGGSVMLPGGRIITAKHELPGDVEMALMTGDTARAAVAEDELEEKIAQDKARLDILRQRRQDQERAAATAPRAPADEAARDAERQALLAGGLAPEGTQATAPAPNQPAGTAPAHQTPTPPADAGKGKAK